MGNAGREHGKDYLLLYEKGIRGIRRCKLLMEELERYEGVSFILSADCKENIGYLKELEANKKELENRIQKYEDMCRRVTVSVEYLEGIEKEVVTLRYMEGRTWDSIAEKTGYSVGNIHRIHNRALENIMQH